MTRPVPLFETEDHEAEECALAEAEADLAAGRVVPHEEVRQWLEDLAAGHWRPRPQPWK